MAKRRKSKFDTYVDKIWRKNVKKLKEIGKYPYDRSPGEIAIAGILQKLKIRYIPEYYIELEGDTKKYRLVDFYLPKRNFGNRKNPEVDVCLEHLGGWNRNELEKKRYRKKMAVFYKNYLVLIPTFPNNLNNLENILKKRLEEAPIKRIGFYV